MSESTLLTKAPRSLKEQWLLEGLQALLLCPSKSDKHKIRMERWWNDNDRDKPMHSEKNQFQYHLLHPNSHVYLPGIEPDSPQWVKDKVRTHLKSPLQPHSKQSVSVLTRQATYV